MIPAACFPRSLRLLAIGVGVAVLPMVASAGSFGGPRPFTGGSPLVTGSDGVYQCVATGKNLTGIITWTIANGVQTSSGGNNNWFFFVDGQSLSGPTTANISDARVNGVLDSSITGAIDPDGDGQITLPLIYIAPGNAATGRFWGKVDFSSQLSAIDGNGELVGTPSRTDQIIIVSGNDSGAAAVSVTEFTIPGGDLPDTSFKLRGTRLSSGSAASNTTTQPTTTTDADG